MINLIKNGDGTTVCLETIEEMIVNRFENEPFPYLSDILGSDWFANFGPRFPESSRQFQEKALERAADYYTYSWKS